MAPSKKLAFPACCGKLFLAAFLLLSPFFGYAQEDPAIRDIIEQLAPELGEDFDFSELTENLSNYRRKPFNLNKADQQQLRSLIFLSPLQISNLLSYRSSNGFLKNVLELQSIDGFDIQTIERLLPFVTVGAAAENKELFSKQLFKASEQELFLRFGQILEKQRGFQDLPGSRYLGTREKLLGKYKYRYKDMLTASLVLEKDAGEYLFAGNNKSAMDFMSGNISYSGKGRLRQVVVGDYNLQFGQGLTMWSGFGYGKGPDVTSVAKKDLGLRPYSSANEVSYLRGACVNLGLNQKFSLTAFGSSRRLDASTKTAGDGTITQVNMGSSGLHRTATEIRNKNALGQLVAGAAIQYLSDNLTAGIVTYGSHYSNAFVTGPLGYNQYNFTGKDLYNVGLHYNYTYQNIYFYGELARSVDGGSALVQGAMLSLSKALSAVAVVRKYDKNYHSFFTRSLGETTEASNETGLYTGLNYSPNKKFSFALYGDVFKFPGLKYRVDLPSKGHEILAQGIYTPNKTIKATLRFKTESKQQNPEENADSTYIVGLNKRNYRLALAWQVSKLLSLEHRSEFVQYSKAQVHDMGFMIYQDVSIHPSGKKLSGNARVAYFKTDSYNSRVYAYEDDVLYSAGFGMYNGRGIRSYLNLRYKILRSLDLWIRYATFIYHDVETVGSGLDQIQGNRKDEVKVQLRYQF